VKDTIVLPAYDCYTLTLYDSGNNGLCCSNGNGGYQLDDKQGGVVKTGGSFSSSESIEFNHESSSSINPIELSKSITVHPNPFNEKATLTFYLQKEEKVTIGMYNMVGQCIKSFDLGKREAGNNEFEIISSDVPSGLYFIRLQAGTAIYTQKVVID
jgi:hypothetical protein